MVGVPHEYALKLIMENFVIGQIQPQQNQIQELRIILVVKFHYLILHHYMPIYLNYIIFKLIRNHGLLDDDLYALATLQKLLGGGSSFSAGGPGKGMFSRLYTKVLNKYPFVENCMSFNHSYIDSGIFGITLSLVPEAAHVSSQSLLMN